MRSTTTLPGVLPSWALGVLPSWAAARSACLLGVGCCGCAFRRRMCGGVMHDPAGRAETRVLRAILVLSTSARIW